MRGGDRFKTQDLSPAAIDLDRGKVATSTLVAPLYSNCSADATWRVRFAVCRRHKPPTRSPQSGSTDASIGSTVRFSIGSGIAAGV